jgi:hypothetical protein
MAQDLADLGQRPASVQHGGRGSVPQPVSTDQANTGPSFAKSRHPVAVSRLQEVSNAVT